MEYALRQSLKAFLFGTKAQYEPPLQSTLPFNRTS